MPAIPIINTLPGLQQWQQALQSATKGVLTPRIPWNFTVTSKQGGNYLTWQSVSGADGYIVDISQNGDFSTGIISINLPGNNNTAYFDTVPTAAGATPAIRYYRVRATAGTVQQPQSVQGLTTGVISSTAIPPNNTTTASTTTMDTTTNDQTQTGTQTGPYRNSKLDQL